jgi:hypothetical protein
MHCQAAARITRKVFLGHVSVLTLKYPASFDKERDVTARLTRQEAPPTPFASCGFQTNVYIN